VFVGTARAGNFSRVHERRTGRDLNAAGDVWLGKIHAGNAAGGVEFVEEIAAERRLDFHSVVRKRFVAALGANGERGEFQRLDFVPGRGAKSIEIAFDGLRDGKINNSKNALDSFNGRGNQRAGRETYEKTISRLLNSLHRNSVEGLPQRLRQFAQKEFSIAASF
jgi:hypothetical protein